MIKNKTKTGDISVFEFLFVWKPKKKKNYDIFNNKNETIHFIDGNFNSHPILNWTVNNLDHDLRHNTLKGESPNITLNIIYSELFSPPLHLTFVIVSLFWGDSNNFDSIWNVNKLK